MINSSQVQSGQLHGIEKPCECPHNRTAVEIDIGYHEPETFMNTNVAIHSMNKLDEKVQVGEGIIDFYNCAVKQKILIQGHMYISNMNIFFFS